MSTPVTDGGLSAPLDDEDSPTLLFEESTYSSFVASSPWPWLGYKEFMKAYQQIGHYTLVSPDRCYMLYGLASQALYLKEAFWECGVYMGGTAMMFANLLAAKDPAGATKLHLFDTFEGMPDTDPEKDLHKSGDFADTNVERVRKRVGHSNRVAFHKGFIPKTFAGMENTKIAFAHIDVDIYQSVWDCCAFIYPRLVAGGFMVFDDYGFPSCPGASKAVDDFFADKLEKPLILPTGQALIFGAPNREKWQWFKSKLTDKLWRLSYRAYGQTKPNGLLKT